MTKSDALAKFGGSDATAAQRISSMAEFLGISRTAIYLWREEKIPRERELEIQLRAAEIEKFVAERAIAPAQGRPDGGGSGITTGGLNT